MRVVLMVLWTMPWGVGCGDDAAKTVDASEATALVEDPYGLCGRFAYGQFRGTKYFNSSESWSWSGWADGGWEESKTREGVGRTSYHYSCTDDGILLSSQSEYWYGNDGGLADSQCEVTHEPPVLIWKHGAGVGTQWSTPSVTTRRCVGEEMGTGEPYDETEVSESDWSREVVAEGPIELEAGTFETLAVDVDSERIEWVSEGLGVVAVSRDLEERPFRELEEYVIHTDD